LLGADAGGLEHVPVAEHDAVGKHLFWRAFAHDQPVALPLRMQRGHPLAPAVERNLGEAWGAGFDRPFVEADSRGRTQNRDLGGISGGTSVGEQCRVVAEDPGPQ